MNKSAVLHIPLSQYAFASGERELTVRIRAGRKDLTKCTLYYADRACKSVPIEFQGIPMQAAYSDELFDYYESVIKSPYSRICYFFKLEKEEEWTYYYADEFKREIPDIKVNGLLIDTRSEYYQYPFLLKSEILKEPEWFKNAFVYNIFPDSFATGNEYIEKAPKEIEAPDKLKCKSKLGGTLRGIMENLDYIKGMGFDCLYLNPIFLAGESHKYDIRDYFKIDPCFGTGDDFRMLVEAVHERNMYIVIDGVFNHCSWDFFAFRDVVRKGKDSRYWKWFYCLEEPVVRPEGEKEEPGYACFAYERKMPKLNTANPEVREYFCNVCSYWMEEYGIDGWRLDVANEVDKDFWRGFRSQTKKINGNAVLIGEVWENSEVWLRGDMFDSTMNYDFRRHCRDFFALKKIESGTFADRITAMYLRYPKEVSEGQLNILDSHDVPRFLSLCGGNVRLWKMSVCFLMMMPGVPCLFYGDEKGIEGIREEQYRQAMPWESHEVTVEKTGLEEMIAELAAIRKKYIKPEDGFHIYAEEKRLVLHRGEVVKVIFDREEETYAIQLRNLS
ncbi:glycosidase [Kineothrix alysoides]|uniref:Glycosidase n=1 Tax=Kineothrix alysoides TaxID=1469948 RepID=A0A4R1QYQ0_9FIRM|nr:glycoside hydrolase family 13 protein [Kineothrix alysoides]TCL58090.1 glycosidase [Kineothrix alysoides]